MNYEFFKVKVSQTESFEDYLKLVEKEVKKFVQDIDLKTYGQCQEFFETLYNPLKELKDTDNLKWIEDSSGKDLFKSQTVLTLETPSYVEKEPNDNCRESLAIVIDNQFMNEYTLVDNLTKEEVKTLELNVKGVMIKTITEFSELKIQKELLEENKDVLITQRLMMDNTTKQTMKM